MITRYRHIIWDWNGTLFDDAWLCIEIINGLLARRRLPTVDADRYQQQFTFPVQEYYRRLGFDFTRESFATLAAEFVADYDRRRFECALQPHAATVLNQLASHGIPQSILSAYEQYRLEEMVAFTGIHTHFQQLIGLSDCHAVSKVEQGTMLMQSLDCDPVEMLLIGDTLHDAEVAAAMGIACVLIPSGHHTRAMLQTSGADIANSLAELCPRSPRATPMQAARVSRKA